MNLNDSERRAMLTTYDNIKYFNANKRKGLLAVIYYVDNGNRADVTKDGIKIVSGATIEQAMYAVVAIINYESKRW